jgi:hypothetical protein
MGFESAEVALGVRVGRAARLDLAAWGARDRLGLDPPADAFHASSESGAATVRMRGLVGRRTFVTGAVYATRVAEQAGAASTSLDETAAALDVERALSLAHTLSVGGKAVGRRVAPGADGDTPDRRAAEVDVYASDTWSPAGPWQVQAGLRLDAVHGEAWSATVSPRVFVRWTPIADQLVVRAGLSRQVQTVQRLVRLAGPFPLIGTGWAVAGPDGAPAAAWQLGLGAEWAPTEALAFSVDTYGRTERDVLRPDAPFTGGPVAFSPHTGRAAGLDVAARLVTDVWTVSLAGAAAVTDVRAPGGAWRPAPYARPLSVGLLAERTLGPLALGARLDAASGRADASRRAPADLRAGLAVGAGTTRRGVRLDALAQVQVRLAGAAGGADVDPLAPLPLALDARALPAYPTLSVAARW